MSTSISPAMQPILLFGPSTADVSWLNSEADYLNTISNAVAFLPGVIADAKAGEAAFAAANPQAAPSFTSPSRILQQIADAASSDRLKSDAARLKTLSSQVTSLLTQSAFQTQQIAGLQQQLAALQGPGSTLVKGGTPTTTTTTTTTKPASGVSTGAMIAGIAAIAALGAGAWWYMEEQKKPASSMKRRP
jgi:hypothetical protein